MTGLGKTQVQSFSSLLLSGVISQGSRAPLDYIFIKTFDQMRKSSLLRWIPENVYYRLNPIFWNFVSGLFVIFLYLRRIYSEAGKNPVYFFQVLCLSAALILYYFWPSNIYFSAEMRPYALWNSLWFSLAALVFLFPESFWGAFFLALFLAMTSSGALFQLLMLALSFVLFSFLKRKDSKRALIGVIKKFALPVLVTLFYSIRSKMGYCDRPEAYQGYVTAFFTFWESQWFVSIFSVAGIVLMVFSARYPTGSVVFGAMLLLYIFSPLANYVMLRSGFFFDGRQYLYYHLIFPLFFLGLSLVLPDYWEKIGGRFSCFSAKRSLLPY
ncbi:MAG: hypothetical protein HQL16_03260 [Candidatus Omnitrophica bacterium]|nr:hypothetical protein [Candidatus Omnitrophota bacterium]